MTPTSLVAYVALFAGAAFLFLFAALLLGRFLRARAPTPEKLAPYECGEPPVGSSYVQFDLRFYVVALVFLVFDVEAAFLFPWAVVFGKAAQLDAAATAAADRPDQPALVRTVAEKCRELGDSTPQELGLVGASARRLARVAMIDLAIFFLVLLVGYAYVWSRGDLDWGRAGGQRGAVPGPAPTPQ